MFRPYSKEEQLGKKKTSNVKVASHSTKIVKKKNKKAAPRYRSSDGKTYSQKQIDNRKNKEYAKNPKPSDSVCECCGEKRAEHHDHTISQRTCKILHKTELIWFEGNWSLSCGKCHHDYESYKSGEFQNHNNVVERMLFIKMHDKEGFRKRLNYINNVELLNMLK